MAYVPPIRTSPPVPIGSCEYHVQITGSVWKCMSTQEYTVMKNQEDKIREETIEEYLALLAYSWPYVIVICVIIFISWLLTHNID